MFDGPEFEDYRNWCEINHRMIGTLQRTIGALTSADGNGETIQKQVLPCVQSLAHDCSLLQKTSYGLVLRHEAGEHVWNLFKAISSIAPEDREFLLRSEGVQELLGNLVSATSHSALLLLWPLQQFSLLFDLDFTSHDISSSAPPFVRYSLRSFAATATQEAASELPEAVRALSAIKLLMASIPDEETKRALAFAGDRPAAESITQVVERTCAESMRIYLRVIKDGLDRLKDAQGNLPDCVTQDHLIALGELVIMIDTYAPAVAGPLIDKAYE